MKSLIIEGTEDSPSVKFDVNSGQFVIGGKSRPENTVKFFTPIIDWITGFYAKKSTRIADNPPVVFVFKFEYFNSISAKYILDIMFSLKDFISEGNKIGIEWHYAKLDDDMLETGKEFSNMVNLKFDFIQH
ncbi:MAG: DUF1987 domain-containing protein [Bacteroidota bacterium]|nr:DUF1987 domain-containing protein [Bacteroidia bacterium]MDP1744468.1 DUF1987 domain-containing protein [Bacteroidota bacterium]